MITIEKLREYGANVDEGLARCVNNSDLYLMLMNMAREDKNFEALKVSLENGDLEAAFNAAHALKGILGNLSLTPMYDLDVEITELLRHREEADYETLCSRLMEEKEKFDALF